jgi:hypothetical protein
MKKSVVNLGTRNSWIVVGLKHDWAGLVGLIEEILDWTNLCIIFVLTVVYSLTDAAIF